jgi:glycerophosphoryl diester phosphodiesterase
LDLVVEHGRHVLVNVELKATRERRAELVRNAWHEVVRRRLHTQVVFSSFDWLLLRDLRRYAADAELAVLSTCWNLHVARAAEDIAASAVHLDVGSLDAEAAEQVHEQGLTLRAFTVNDLVTVAHLSSLGVDGVFTDHPDQLLTVYRR